MEIAFDIKLRYSVCQILPERNTLKDYQLKKFITDKLAITEEEIGKYGLKNNCGVITWDKEKDVPIVIDMSDDEIAYIKRSCDKMLESELSDEEWCAVFRVYNTII